MEIHHGNPNGTFTIAPVYSKSYSNADFISPFATRDLNGDGYPDILALSADGLVIFFGKPGMQFSAPVHYAFYNPESFDEDQGDPSLIADYNLDGNLDLAMPGVNGIYITYGRSDGTFDASPVIRSGLSSNYSNLFADFNEDEYPGHLHRRHARSPTESRQGQWYIRGACDGSGCGIVPQLLFRSACGAV